MWQLGGFARRSPTIDRRPDRSPGATAQGPEMSPEMPVARLCALPEPRPPRASRSPKRAEVRHPAVDVTGADWRNCDTRGGVSDRSAQRTSACPRLSIRPEQATLRRARCRIRVVRRPRVTPRRAEPFVWCQLLNERGWAGGSHRAARVPVAAAGAMSAGRDRRANQGGRVSGLLA
jgi:hypothetical protein